MWTVDVCVLNSDQTWGTLSVSFTELELYDLNTEGVSLQEKAKRLALDRGRKMSDIGLAVISCTRFDGSEV